MYLSPYVEKPLHSKVIKSFVPELRSRKCFFVFRDPSVIYIYMFMNILCTFHISVSSVCYIKTGDSTLRAFDVHFMLYQNDVAPDRIINTYQFKFSIRKRTGSSYDRN